MTSPYRIGVDVGGTNTDAVILDTSLNSPSPIVATFKTPTTQDVSSGIQAAIRQVLADSKLDHSSIQSIVIGTTSFVNSLVERDASKLQKVSVIRLSSVYSQMVPPFISFPIDLRKMLEGSVFFAAGGLQVDGSEIEAVNPEEIRGICAALRAQGEDHAIVVSGCYSPIDYSYKQEEAVRDIILEELPHSRVVMSRDVANLGLMQRENASILNAALLRFAEHVVAAFNQSVVAIGLNCPMFLTANDGTLIEGSVASSFPIQTFSSGPTNSMRGAHFLAAKAKDNETALVVDVGGTTTEIGVLLPTGFPRQAASTHSLCGVPLNFSMPHVLSIGLGGGSLVHREVEVSIGPDSVGYRLQEDALCFGGTTLTTTDVHVASGKAQIGSVKPGLDTALIESVEGKIKQMLEAAIDRMKTSPEDIAVYLVGGGAMLVPDGLQGVSKVYRFENSNVANAIGAACAQVSGLIDTFEQTAGSVQDVQRMIEDKAKAKAVSFGADPNQVKIVESECIPIAYTADRARFYVKAAGPWSGAPRKEIYNTRPPKQAKSVSPSTAIPPSNTDKSALDGVADNDPTAAEMLAYRPNVKNGFWNLSDLDLQWICTGCYILGTGGGGNPWTIYLALREMVRRGSTIRVIDIDHLPSDKLVCWGGGIGSPEVGSERLIGGDPTEAIRELLGFMRLENKLGAMCAIEIGGGNGMANMLAGASEHLDVPIIDGDVMGRAYPTGWQTTLSVMDESNRSQLSLPCCMVSGNGTATFVTRVRHFKDVDKILRAGCMEMGTAASVAARPLTKHEVQQALIRNTVSQSWRIGREVALANKQSTIGRIGEVLVEATGGRKSSRVLFAGKVTELGRKMIKGHSHGVVTIQSLRDGGFEGLVRIPFMNENLLCEHVLGEKTTVLAGVPDLIAIIDAQNGSAIGTQDYKYGLQVIVLGITAAPQWTKSAKGLELGSLTAFGYDLPYCPLGEYVKPRSVIEEYNVEV